MSKNEEHTEGQQAKPKGRPKIEIDVAEDGENGSHAVYEKPVMGGI